MQLTAHLNRYESELAKKLTAELGGTVTIAGGVASDPINVVQLIEHTVREQMRVDLKEI